MNRKTVLLLVALLSLTLACSISGLPAGGSTPVGNTNNTKSGSSHPSTPVSIRAGLASLNTYTLAIASNFSGPTKADFTKSNIEIDKSKDSDATSIHYVTSESSASDTSSSQSDSYSYTIGNAQCSGSDADGWEYSENTPQQKEMSDLFYGMMDVIPLIDSPTYVGSETMNGIETNHFTFKVSGLGLQSGAEVTANQGEYWLAKDGQYIVKYTLITETLDSTTQTAMHMEILIDLTTVNQPVSIAFPAGCKP